MANIEATEAGSGRASKSPDAFRTIREGSEELDVPQHVLRFWETKFNQVRPLKRGGGRRYYRPEDVDGVWDFARGCMRTYNILKERAIGFDADPEVKELIAEMVDSNIDPLLKDYSAEKVDALRSLSIDPEAIGATGLQWERLDQILIEHLLGTR